MCDNAQALAEQCLGTPELTGVEQEIGHLHKPI